MPVGDTDIVRCVLSGTTVHGDEFKNVFTWKATKVSLGDWSDSDAGTFLTDAIEAVFAEVLDEIKSTVSFDTVDLYKWVAPDWDYLTTKTPSITPIGAADVTPPGVAALMTAYTDLNKVFGRKFLYGFMETVMTGGVLTAGALTALAAAAGVYIASWQSGTMGPLDYFVPGVYSTKAIDFEPFNGIAVVKDALSYQRRRKQGVGV